MNIIVVLILCAMIAACLCGLILSIKGIYCLIQKRTRSGLIYLVAGILLCHSMAALIILPAITCRPHKSRRSECCNNLSQIGKCMKMYSMDHDDRFPDSFDDLSPEYIQQAKLVLCPESGTDEDRHSYILVSGLSETNSPNSVHAYCPTGSHGGKGGNILFLDGSIEWRPSEHHKDFNKTTQSPSFEEVIRQGHN